MRRGARDRVPHGGTLTSLKTALREVGSVSVLDLSGKITIGEGDSLLREQVHNLLEAGHSKIVLNLEAVSYMDSAGIGELVACY